MAGVASAVRSTAFTTQRRPVRVVRSVVVGQNRSEFLLSRTRAAETGRANKFFDPICFHHLVQNPKGDGRRISFPLTGNFDYFAKGIDFQILYLAIAGDQGVSPGSSSSTGEDIFGRIEHSAGVHRMRTPHVQRVPSSMANRLLPENNRQPAGDLQSNYLSLVRSAFRRRVFSPAGAGRIPT
jgi:hypothetical protein